MWEVDILGPDFATRGLEFATRGPEFATRSDTRSAAWSLPATRAGGKDDCSWTNSLKQLSMDRVSQRSGSPSMYPPHAPTLETRSLAQTSGLGPAQEVAGALQDPAQEVAGALQDPAQEVGNIVDIED